eukprot:2401215-Amphidinium_carterae.1
MQREKARPLGQPSHSGGKEAGHMAMFSQEVRKTKAWRIWDSVQTQSRQCYPTVARRGTMLVCQVSTLKSAPRFQARVKIV